MLLDTLHFLTSSTSMNLRLAAPLVHDLSVFLPFSVLCPLKLIKLVLLFHRCRPQWFGHCRGTSPESLSSSSLNVYQSQHDLCLSQRTTKISASSGIRDFVHTLTLCTWNNSAFFSRVSPRRPACLRLVGHNNGGQKSYIWPHFLRESDSHPVDPFIFGRGFPPLTPSICEVFRKHGCVSWFVKLRLTE